MALDKLVDSSQLDTDLTSVANAIRAKGGTSSQLAFPAGFVSAVQAIPTGGTPTGTKQISITANGTTTEDVAAYANAEITVNVQGGGGYTADEIVSSTGISGTFTITITWVRQFALAYCNGITEIVAPNLTSFSTHCFSYMTGLTRASFPALTASYAKFMVGDTNLVSISLPALTTIRNDQFIENSGLVHLVLPSFTGTIYNNSLKTNVSLLAVDLNAATSIGTTAFSGCSALSTLIIRGNSLTALNNINAFTNTPFASGKAGGTLYVPQDLISSYQAATNWSTILGYANNQIKSIESTATDPDAPVDLTTHYIDGTPIPTT